MKTKQKSLKIIDRKYSDGLRGIYANRIIVKVLWKGDTGYLYYYADTVSGRKPQIPSPDGEPNVIFK